MTSNLASKTQVFGIMAIMIFAGFGLQGQAFAIPPVTVPDAYTVDNAGTIDTANDITVPSVLDNDTDLENDPLTATLVIPPLFASSFNFFNDGNFTYTHDGSATLVDTFTYFSHDGLFPGNIATVTITINAVGSGPGSSGSTNDNDEYYVPSAEELANIADRNLKSTITNSLNDNKIKQATNLNLKSIKNIDSKFLTISNSDNPENDAKRFGLLYDGKKTKVVLEISNIEEKQLDIITSLGNVDFITDKYIQMSLDLEKLSYLYSLHGLEKIRAPYSPVLYNSEISEGVHLINADIVQFAGITGKGIKVAVIDMGFDLDNTKISNNVVDAQSFRYGLDGNTISMLGLGEESTHGTAVAELIIDTAPNVELFLYSMGNDLEFAEAMDKAISQNVDLITLSLGWPNLPTDGKSFITSKVNEAISKDIIVVVPAGNFAQKHWEGSFIDSNSNNWHEFSQVDEGLTFNVTTDRILDQTPIKVNLMWNNGVGDIIDYDMVLIGPGDVLVDFSANKQTTHDDELFEQISYIPSEEGIYMLGIVYDGDYERPDVGIEVFSIYDDLEHFISQGSVTVPSDASDVIVTGAMNLFSYEIESFSSQGPTNNGLNVPHVLAPNGVSTLAYGDKPFYGTSATAPYVTGMTALLLEKNSDSSSSNVLQKIKENANLQLFTSLNTCDNTVGCGLINAEFIIR